MRLDVCHYPGEINLSTHLQLLDILGDKLFDVEIVTLLNGLHLCRVNMPLHFDWPRGPLASPVSCPTHNLCRECGRQKALRPATRDKNTWRQASKLWCAKEMRQEKRPAWQHQKLAYYHARWLGCSRVLGKYKKAFSLQSPNATQGVEGAHCLLRSGAIPT